MIQDYTDDNVYIQRKEPLGIITLANEKSLNALTLEMVRQISSALHNWKNDPKIKAVIFKAANDKAFCAGADMKSFYQLGMDYRRGNISAKAPMVFFAEEYHMCKQIAAFPKPTLTLMNGIVMGGGYGIGGHCKYKIVSENTKFAMPEVGIGFFPDVGIIKRLAETENAFGRYLALTGDTIEAGDMLAAGLADYYIPSAHYVELLKEIESAPDQIEKILSKHNAEKSCKADIFLKHKKDIVECFSPENIGGILTKLKEGKSNWHQKTLERLHSVSAVSVAVTLEYLNRAAKMTQGEVFTQDFILTQHYMNSSDLYEGIRAQLIDKDRKPLWQIKNLEECSPSEVKAYFKPTGYEFNDIVIFED